MTNRSYNKKCPQCGVVNHSWTPITTCTECNAPLLNVRADGSLPGDRLEPCEDCHNLISRGAESCPYCGRFYRSLRQRGVERGRGWWVMTILIAMSAFAFMVYWVAALTLWVHGGVGPP